MSYESVVLELMQRIQNLENDVTDMRESISELQDNIRDLQDNIRILSERDEEVIIDLSDELNSGGKKTIDDAPSDKEGAARVRMTDDMIDACYEYAKKAYSNPELSMEKLAVQIAEETGMNKSSAFIYLCSIKSLLEGTVFKRAISMKALRRYFALIYDEFGKKGLAKAIQSAMEHAEYREKYGIPGSSVVALCEEFRKRL